MPCNAPGAWLTFTKRYTHNLGEHYFTIKGRQILLLLAGGDKSTQAKDIKLAQDLARMDVEL